MLSYLRGLARRQVKKHSRPKASSRRRKLRTPVRTASRVGDRRAMLGQRELLDAASTTLYTPSHTALDAHSKALGQWLVTWLCPHVNLWGLGRMKWEGNSTRSSPPPAPSSPT